MNMQRQYRFCCLAIQSGRTVLIYHGVTDQKPAHVKDAGRLALVDGALYLDGRSCKGMTIALMP